MFDDLEDPPAVKLEKALDRMEGRLKDIDAATGSTAQALDAITEDVGHLKALALDLRDAMMHGPWADGRASAAHLVAIKRILIAILVVSALHLFK